MHLIQLAEAVKLFPSIRSEEIKSFGARKIHYLITGRNAWHSTWVQNYWPKCISSHSSELEQDAEKKRGPGTTFQIKELPALVFATKSGSAVITEINTDYPLKNYSPRSYLASQNQCNLLRSPDDPALQVFVGSTLGALMRSLENSSGCWNYPPRHQSIFSMFLPQGNLEDFEAAADYYSFKESGRSGGSKNSIGWSIRTGKIKSDYIESLANMT